MQFYYMVISRFSSLKLSIPGGKMKGVIFSFDVETWENICGGLVEPTADPEDEYFRYIPRLLDLLKDYSIPAHFFVCGKTLGLYPEVFKMVLKRGHTIGGHGYAHEKMSSLSSEEQKNIIKKVKSILSEKLGISLKTWRCPWLVANRATYRALKECGVKICSNAPWGRPVIIQDVLEIPMVRKMDDQILGCHGRQKGLNPRLWANYMKNKFENADEGILVFGMHTWVQRKYDPKIEALTTFLNFLETRKDEIWIGNLDHLCE
jgi:peptidoglycan/xylan/chitin deacetylase (PgdA/CDA1 family)